MAIKCLNDAHGEKWAAYHGDCVDVCRQLPDESVGFSIFSPPFSNLFVYSDSVADMGNCEDDGQFFEQYEYLTYELIRLTNPGRLCAVHVSDLPSFKGKHGHVGIRDFSGMTIRAHEAAGWIYHSRITVWKDPVVEMQRTKAIGLLYKQLIKDSAMSRVGIPDYVLVFRKPGDNPEPIGHERGDFPVDLWQKWASPVWMDIKQGNVLDKGKARDTKDEKHIVPLQLDLIERAIQLWSNPGDTVLSPFMGIGSEGVSATKLHRYFIGVELKESYFNQAVRHLDASTKQASLFTECA